MSWTRAPGSDLFPGLSARHPREAGSFSRRVFLERSATAALGISAVGPLLAACGGANNGAGTGGSAAAAADLQLARQDNPVKWPIYEDNPPIASGLEPEGGPLKVYNWNGYLWPRIMKQFGKEFGVDVELTTFSTGDEAIQKLATGAVDFDVFFPFPDRLGRLIVGKLLQPLNHDYLPNLATSIWPSLQDPFYDRGSQYTVPYTIYTTGIGYRTDQVDTTPDQLSNPYDIYWDERNKGKTYLLDDSREATIHMLLKNGIDDINTENPEEIDVAKQDLIALTDAVNVKVSTDDYTNLPEGKAWVHEAWSGSLISAPYYLPKGVGPEVLGFWFPEDGKGTIGNDMMGVLKSAKNPVLAHHFVNYLLDKKHGYDNFVNFVGYQPPFVSIDPDSLVSDEIVPENLKTAVVRESDFDTGYFLAELSPQGQMIWQNAWAEFKAGV